MVYEGIRTATLDVDLTYEVADSDHAELIRVLRSLKEQLAINIEEASPQEFLPLPPGHQERARFVGRFGQVDVFHFDPYSVALSKIERGSEVDFADVVGLLDAGWLDFHVLQGHFEAILPGMAELSLRADPREFQRKFSHLKSLWGAGKG